MHQLLKRFLDDRSGNILIMTGIGFLFLVGIGGAGYDLGRQQLVKQRIQQASDAAAVAAAGMNVGATVATRTLMAQNIYNLNFPTQYLGVNRPAPAIIITPTQVQVSANANVATAFVNNFNNGAGPVTLASAGSSRVLIKNDKIDFDLVVLVDESGSTAAGCAACIGTRMNTERLAINSMIDIIFPAGPVNPDVRFGLIGYTQWISNKWGLTSIKAEAVASVASLSSKQANFEEFGLEAAKNMLTNITTVTTANGPTAWPALMGPPASGWWPNGRIARKDTDVPPPRSARSDAAALSSVKSLVLITDGEIMREPNGCPWGSYMLDSTVGVSCPNYPVFLSACQAVKDAGIKLFVISFASENPLDVGPLNACASVDPFTGSPYYYFAPTGPQLNTILQNIANLLIKVRIVQ